MKKLKILLEDVTFSRASLSVDQQIDDLLHKAEREAVQVAMQNQADGVEESLKHLSIKFLFKEEKDDGRAPPIDVATFTTQIIRYLTMYKKIADIPDIIDIPAVIANKAADFLKKKYGEDISKQFMDDILKNPDVGNTVDFKYGKSSSDNILQPLAVGATGGGGGA